MFGLFGVWLMLAPSMLDEWLGIVATNPAARTELRALYGGMELGLAAFLVAGAWRPSLTGAACLALSLVMAGVALGRLLGFVLDDSASAKLWAFLASEVLFAGLGWLGWRRAASGS